MDTDAPAPLPTAVGRPRGDAMRSRLLDVAEQRFARTGFHGTSLAVIAGDCGLGNAGLLHHFASKSRLYRAVLQGLADELEARLVRATAASSPRRRLFSALLGHLDFILERPAGARLLMRELLDNAERVEEAHTLPLADFTVEMCRLIDAAQAGAPGRRPVAIVQLCQYLGALNYALAVRPTFHRLRDDAVLRDDVAWLRAVAAASVRSLAGPFTSGRTLP